MSKMKRILPIFAVIFVVLMSGVNALLYLLSPPTEETTLPMPRQAIAVENRHTETIYNRFRTNLELILGERVKDYAVYFYCPDLDEKPLYWQSRPMRAASMIKIFILAKAMADADEGKFSLTDKLVLKEKDMVDGAGVLDGEPSGRQMEIGELLELMIKESDNTATNMMIDFLGMEAINQHLSEHLYTDTILQHKMMVSNNGKGNFTSVRDVGDLFTKIYRRECVDEYHDGIMLKYLLRQTDNECLPAVLPGWQIAHKTGEVTGVYHDGGIFFGTKGNFILVIMSESDEGRAYVIENMQAIAKMAVDML